MDELDRAIVNRLQGGFPLGERPFLESAAALGIEEDALIARLRKLLEANVLTRFGPLYDAEKLGGHLTLCAMSVPAADFERVAALVNAHPEVAHNYERAHALNMWFVVATERPEDVGRVLADIASETGLVVHDMRKLEEFFVGLRFEA